MKIRLNSRKKLQHERTRASADEPHAPSFLAGLTAPFKSSRHNEAFEKSARQTIVSTFPIWIARIMSNHVTYQVEINVERTIDFTVEEDYDRHLSPVSADCKV